MEAQIHVDPVDPDSDPQHCWTVVKMDTGTRRSQSRQAENNLTSTLMKRHVILLSGRSYHWIPVRVVHTLEWVTTTLPRLKQTCVCKSGLSLRRRKRLYLDDRSAGSTLAAMHVWGVTIQGLLSNYIYDGSPRNVPRL